MITSGSYESHAFLTELISESLIRFLSYRFVNMIEMKLTTFTRYFSAFSFLR